MYKEKIIVIIINCHLLQVTDVRKCTELFGVNFSKNLATHKMTITIKKTLLCFVEKGTHDYFLCHKWSQNDEWITVCCLIFQNQVIICILSSFMITRLTISLTHHPWRNYVFSSEKKIISKSNTSVLFSVATVANKIGKVEGRHTSSAAYTTVYCKVKMSQILRIAFAQLRLYAFLCQKICSSNSPKSWHGIIAMPRHCFPAKRSSSRFATGFLYNGVNLPGSDR